MMGVVVPFLCSGPPAHDALWAAAQPRMRSLLAAYALGESGVLRSSRESASFQGGCPLRMCERRPRCVLAPVLLFPAPFRAVALPVTFLPAAERGEKMAAAGLQQQVRHFSTGMAMHVSKLIRPPIQVFGLEGRYATALYSAASKEKKLEQVEKDLIRISAFVKEPKMSAIIVNPHIKRGIKQKNLSDILTKEKLSPITINFVNLLAENGRLSNTASIISAFSKIMSAHRGEILCAVTTARPLDEVTLADLKTALNGFLAKGQVLQLETKTDPAILGGMVISIGDKYIDMSTKAKIQKLTKIMRDTA